MRLYLGTLTATDFAPRHRVPGRPPPVNNVLVQRGDRCLVVTLRRNYSRGERRRIPLRLAGGVWTIDGPALADVLRQIAGRWGADLPIDWRVDAPCPAVLPADPLPAPAPVSLGELPGGV